MPSATMEWIQSICGHTRSLPQADQVECIPGKLTRCGAPQRFRQKADHVCAPRLPVAQSQAPRRSRLDATRPFDFRLPYVRPRSLPESRCGVRALWCAQFQPIPRAHHPAFPEVEILYGGNSPFNRAKALSCNCRRACDIGRDRLRFSRLSELVRRP